MRQCRARLILLIASRVPSANHGEWRLFLDAPSCFGSTANTTMCRSFCTTAALHQSWARNNMRRWMCVKTDCRAVNKGTAMECETCSTPKPQLRGWKCALCGARNHSGVKKCKQCDAPAEQSEGFWMCAACGENNRVDDIEDNSRCGFCLYDMAPLSRSEEELIQAAQDRHQRLADIQVAFDSITAEDAQRHFGDAHAGASELPQALSQAIGVQSLVTQTRPFEPHKPSSRRSQVYRRHLAHVTTVSLAQAGAVPPGPPGFDWMCRDPGCAHINPGDEEQCHACGVHMSPEDWECQQCAALNHLSRSRCFNCDAGIPICWTCGECGGTTSIYDRECRRCHAVRPAVDPKFPSPRGDDADATGAPSAPRKRPGDWFCDACSAHNFSRRTDCFQCGAARRTRDGGDGAHDTNSSGANNWKCEQCSADNFRTRTSCWQCKAGAPAWVADATAQSGTPRSRFAQEGFQAGPLSPAARAPSEPKWRRSNDWTCAKCYAKNYGRNADCFKCGAPKTAVTMSRRTRVRKPVKL